MKSVTNICCVLFLCAVVVLGCKEEVAHDLGEGEANRLAVIMESHGISVDLERSAGRNDTWTLVVGQSDLPLARALVVEHRLPGEPEEIEDDGLLGPSRQLAHRRAERAKARELEGSLRRLEDVRDARVHLTLPKPSWTNQQEAESSATVLLLTGPDGLPPATERRAQELVRATIGVSGEQLTVIQEAARGELEPPQYARVGPWSVAKGSASELRWTLGVLIVLGILLFALSAFLLVQNRRMRLSREEP